MKKILKDVLISSVIISSACAPDGSRRPEGEEAELIQRIMDDEIARRPVMQTVFEHSLFTARDNGRDVTDPEGKREFVVRIGDRLQEVWANDRVYVQDDLGEKRDGSVDAHFATLGSPEQFMVLARDRKDVWEVPLFLHEAAHGETMRGHSGEYYQTYQEFGRYTPEYVAVVEEHHDGAAMMTLTGEYVRGLVRGEAEFAGEYFGNGYDDNVYQQALEYIENDETRWDHYRVFYSNQAELLGIDEDGFREIIEMEELKDLQREALEEVWNEYLEGREADEARMEIKDTAIGEFGRMGGPSRR